MSWKQRTPMLERTEFIKLANQEASNISQLCDSYGISRKTGYKWLRRLREAGLAGLEDQSRRPLHSPNQTSHEMEEQVLAVRAQYPTWGGRKIRRLLQDGGLLEVPSASTITAILRRNEMIAPEEALKHKAFIHFEHEHPNDLWQMDYKGSFRLTEGGACHPLTVLDDNSRFLMGLKSCPNERRTTVQYHLTSIFEEYGLPERMLMDNGSPWGDDLDSRYTLLTSWLLRLDISISHGRPYHPQTQGKDERLHRTLQDELITRNIFITLDQTQMLFDKWRYEYNYIRPHEALQMNTPASRYVPSTRPFPTTLPPIIYETQDFIRRTDDDGRFCFQGRRFRLGKAFPHHEVAVRPTVQDGVFDVYYCKQKVTRISLLENEP